MTLKYIFYWKRVKMQHNHQKIILKNYIKINTLFKFKIHYTKNLLSYLK